MFTKNKQKEQDVLPVAVYTETLNSVANDSVFQTIFHESEEGFICHLQNNSDISQINFEQNKSILRKLPQDAPVTIASGEYPVTYDLIQGVFFQEYLVLRANSAEIDEIFQIILSALQQYLILKQALEQIQCCVDNFDNIQLIIHQRKPLTREYELTFIGLEFTVRFSETEKLNSQEFFQNLAKTIQNYCLKVLQVKKIIQASTITTNELLIEILMKNQNQNQPLVDLITENIVDTQQLTAACQQNLIMDEDRIIEQILKSRSGYQNISTSIAADYQDKNYPNILLKAQYLNHYTQYNQCLKFIEKNIDIYMDFADLSSRKEKELHFYIIFLYARSLQKLARQQDFQSFMSKMRVNVFRVVYKKYRNSNLYTKCILLYTQLTKDEQQQEQLQALNNERIQNQLLDFKVLLRSLEITKKSSYQLQFDISNSLIQIDQGKRFYLYLKILLLAASLDSDAQVVAKYVFLNYQEQLLKDYLFYKPSLQKIYFQFLKNQAKDPQQNLRIVIKSENVQFDNEILYRIAKNRLKDSQYFNYYRDVLTELATREALCLVDDAGHSRLLFEKLTNELALYEQQKGQWLQKCLYLRDRKQQRLSLACLTVQLQLENSGSRQLTQLYSLIQAEQEFELAKNAKLNVLKHKLIPLQFLFEQDFGKIVQNIRILIQRTNVNKLAEELLEASIDYYLSRYALEDEFFLSPRLTDIWKNLKNNGLIAETTELIFIEQYFTVIRILENFEFRQFTSLANYVQNKQQQHSKQETVQMIIRASEIVQKDDVMCLQNYQKFYSNVAALIIKEQVIQQNLDFLISKVHKNNSAQWLFQKIQTILLFQKTLDEQTTRNTLYLVTNLEQYLKYLPKQSYEILIALLYPSIKYVQNEQLTLNIAKLILELQSDTKDAFVHVFYTSRPLVASSLIIKVLQLADSYKRTVGEPIESLEVYESLLRLSCRQHKLHEVHYVAMKILHCAPKIVETIDVLEEAMKSSLSEEELGQALMRILQDLQGVLAQSKSNKLRDIYLKMMPTSIYLRQFDETTHMVQKIIQMQSLDKKFILQADSILQRLTQVFAPVGSRKLIKDISCIQKIREVVRKSQQQYQIQAELFSEDGISKNILQYQNLHRIIIKQIEQIKLFTNTDCPTQNDLNMSLIDKVVVSSQFTDYVEFYQTLDLLYSQILMLREHAINSANFMKLCKNMALLCVNFRQTQICKEIVAEAFDTLLKQIKIHTEINQRWERFDQILKLLNQHNLKLVRTYQILRVNENISLSDLASQMLEDLEISAIIDRKQANIVVQIISEMEKRGAITVDDFWALQVYKNIFTAFFQCADQIDCYYIARLILLIEKRHLKNVQKIAIYQIDFLTQCMGEFLTKNTFFSDVQARIALSILQLREDINTYDIDIVVKTEDLDCFLLIWSHIFSHFTSASLLATTDIKFALKAIEYLIKHFSHLQQLLCNVSQQSMYKKPNMLVNQQTIIQFIQQAQNIQITAFDKFLMNAVDEKIQIQFKRFLYDHCTTNSNLNKEQLHIIGFYHRNNLFLNSNFIFNCIKPILEEILINTGAISEEFFVKCKELCTKLRKLNLVSDDYSELFSPWIEQTLQQYCESQRDERLLTRLRRIYELGRNVLLCRAEQVQGWPKESVYSQLIYHNRSLKFLLCDLASVFSLFGVNTQLLINYAEQSIQQAVQQEIVNNIEHSQEFQQLKQSIQCQDLQRLIALKLQTTIYMMKDIGQKRFDIFQMILPDECPKCLCEMEQSQEAISSCQKCHQQQLTTNAKCRHCQYILCSACVWHLQENYTDNNSRYSWNRKTQLHIPRCTFCQKVLQKLNSSVHDCARHNCKDSKAPVFACIVHENEVKCINCLEVFSLQQYDAKASILIQELNNLETSIQQVAQIQNIDKSNVMDSSSHSANIQQKSQKNPARLQSAVLRSLAQQSSISSLKQDHEKKSGALNIVNEDEKSVILSQKGSQNRLIEKPKKTDNWKYSYRGEEPPKVKRQERPQTAQPKVSLAQTKSVNSKAIDWSKSQSLLTDNLHHYEINNDNSLFQIPALQIAYFSISIRGNQQPLRLNFLFSNQNAKLKGFISTRTQYPSQFNTQDKFEGKFVKYYDVDSKKQKHTHFKREKLFLALYTNEEIGIQVKVNFGEAVSKLISTTKKRNEKEQAQITQEEKITTKKNDLIKQNVMNATNQFYVKEIRQSSLRREKQRSLSAKKRHKSLKILKDISIFSSIVNKELQHRHFLQEGQAIREKKQIIKLSKRWISTMSYIFLLQRINEKLKESKEKKLRQFMIKRAAKVILAKMKQYSFEIKRKRALMGFGQEHGDLDLD